MSENKKDGGRLTIERYFSEPYGNVYTDSNGLIKYSPRDVQIRDDNGNIVEEIKSAVFPSEWSQHSANTTATKYFRKEGVPETGREIDLRQLVGRVAGTISLWGVEQNYFSDESGKNLEHEIAALSVGQYGAFNSPVWFNLGLDRYFESSDGDESTGTSWTVNPETGKIIETTKYLGQASACFISSPADSIKDMINVGATISSEIFRRGSGIGGSWGYVRSAGEKISGGGKASGAQRFMDVQDSVARVIKSGGKTRRAATFQGIPVWHPDMIDIIRNKYAEEVKGKILVEAGSPSKWESHTHQNLRGQNVNISVRCDDEFWKAYESGKDYAIRYVKDKGESGDGIKEKVPAKKLARIMAYATHGCGDPGIQNHDTINRWHTCKNSGEIVASNPCSEYMFLNNSACNLASVNLMRFRKADGTLDLNSFFRAIDLFITSQDIIVSHAAYPTKEITENSDAFRPLGLGYANLGALLMANGIPYDSDEARDFAAAITSNLTAKAYLQSTQLAEKKGTFKEYEKNKEPMLGVIEMHKKAAQKLNKNNGLEYLVESANEKWKEVLERGRRYGFRNSQVTLLAPTGTIGFMMGCDTTGCEPEILLVKYKELAGGGSMMINNETIPTALKTLGYDNDKIKKILDYLNKDMGNDPKKPSPRATLEGCPDLKEKHLPVFDTSLCPQYGERFISPMAHIKMLAALQPHISGAISKTLNCPENTTVEEIENMFYQSWKLGVKALAIYRDGSKSAQPISTGKKNLVTILKRGEREHLPDSRESMTQKVKIGGTSLFLTAGEYSDGRLGELFIGALERTSEVNRLLNENAVQFSEKLQIGMPFEEAIEIFEKAGSSQISGRTDHPFITKAKGPEGFIYNWLRAHYLGNLSFLLDDDEAKEKELRPLPWELRIYKRVPKLHLMPSVEGITMYPGVPTLEETVEKTSKFNYWEDKEDGLDTCKTIEKIKRERKWKSDKTGGAILSGKISGKTCEKCGSVMLSDGGCLKCPVCMISTGGCGD